MPDENRQPDPRPLSTEYHKAHKQLMLWSAILFIWELVGIDLEKAKETGGNAGAIIAALKSPQAVPWALMILVGYFLFKTNIEWFQCSSARRMLRVARVDFATAWGVPLLAYALYAYQAAKNVQVADVVQDRKTLVITLMLGFAFGFSAGFFTNQLLIQWKNERSFIRWVTLTQVLVTAGVATVFPWYFRFMFGLSFSWRPYFLAILVGLTVSLGLRYLGKRRGFGR